MKHFIIPDTQVKPGQDFKFLERIGQFIVDKKPDVVVQIGDFADMPSLSSYDQGKKSFEGRRYKADVEASVEAMSRLLKPLNDFNIQARRNGKKQYHPRRILTLGNHCDRIDRAVNADAKLEGVLSIDDLQFKEFGWEVYPFLKVVVVDGVAYSHYFSTGAMGRPASSAQAQLNRKHQSCIAGHQQGLQIAMAQRADGRRLTSVIAGSCYEHEEEYMGAQGNQHWRGCLMLHDVNDGEFNLVPVPLDYLKEKYA